MFYRTFLKRNSVFWASIVATAFVGEMIIDTGVDRFWNFYNRGKLWNDIKDNIAQ